MLGAIIKITGACAAAFSINYAVWFKGIPPVAKIAASKMFSDAAPYLNIIVPKIQEILKDHRAYDEVMGEVEKCIYQSTQLTLKALWCVGQVLVAYDNRDPAMQLLGLNSSETNTSHQDNAQETSSSLI